MAVEREKPLDALRNVVMARKNLVNVSACFFLHKRTFTDAQRRDFEQRLTDATNGYFNDFEADNNSTRSQKQTVHFLVTDHDRTVAAPPALFKKAFSDPVNNIMAHSHGCVILTHPDKFTLQDDTAKLEEVLGALGERSTVHLAEREENYVHREMGQFLQMYAPVRKQGKDAPLVCMLPVNKTQDWWNLDMLKRQSFFYPHYDEAGGMAQRRHFHLGAEHIKFFFRKLFHSTVGYQRENAFDFVTYFEMAETKADLFLELLANLRDTAQNPEWDHVQEGTLWFGRRVPGPAELLIK